MRRAAGNIAVKFVMNTAVFMPVLMLFFWTGSAYGQFSLFRGQSEKIEAEANREYYLTDSDGLWFIMAKKFSGPDARKNANKVVFELRKRYKLPAYLFQYDSDEDDLSKLMKQRGGEARKYHYQTVTPPEYAVLVGSFPAVDDPGLQETLLKIKRSKLDSLKNDRESQRLITEYEYLAKKNKEYTGYGPLGKALAVPNPLIPKEFFTQKGVVDPFIEKINSDSPYSLLNNKALYTLRVATFAGNDAYEKDWNEKRDRLADAGVKAASLCEALRKKGVEAWEFHDHDASFVTIGSFDSYGRNNPDGTTELNPEIFELMERYRGELVGDSGTFKTHAVKIELKDPKSKGMSGKKVELELSFDLQPVIIMVPQRPGNAKKVQQAQRQLIQEQENFERIKFNESLAAENTEHSRRYDKALTANASEGVEIDPNTGLAKGADPAAGNQSVVSSNGGNQAAVNPNGGMPAQNKAVSVQTSRPVAAATQNTVQTTVQKTAQRTAPAASAAQVPQQTAAQPAARTYTKQRTARPASAAPTY